jgi:hypothetical protein
MPKPLRDDPSNIYAFSGTWPSRRPHALSGMASSLPSSQPRFGRVPLQ